MIDRVGKEKADDMKRKRKKAYAEVCRKRREKRKKSIIDFFKKNCKRKIVNNSILSLYMSKLGFTNIKILKEYFGSIDDFCDVVDAKRDKRKKFGLGKNEENILKYIEEKKGVVLERQYKVNNFYIDGFDEKNNVAYEIDE